LGPGYKQQRLHSPSQFVLLAARRQEGKAECSVVRHNLLQDRDPARQLLSSLVAAMPFGQHLPPAGRRRPWAALPSAQPPSPSIWRPPHYAAVTHGPASIALDLVPPPAAAFDLVPYLPSLSSINFAERKIISRTEEEVSEAKTIRGVGNSRATSGCPHPADFVGRAQPAF
jgi:hypothetical protein